MLLAMIGASFKHILSVQWASPMFDNLYTSLACEEITVHRRD